MGDVLPEIVLGVEW